MKTLSVIKKIISSGCVINTLLLILTYGLGLLINENFIPTFDRVLGILLFSLALAGANLFLFSKALTLPLRLLIHFLFTTLMFYIMFVLWGSYNQNSGSAFVIVVLFTVAYWTAVGIVSLIRLTNREKTNSKKEYKKVLKKEDDYKSVFGGKN
ncbi:MAG: DUF3021 domain-containing protein [Ruminococcaceae bacterium]|nr:DUF3021 domain-containing protein [Oscillospiraceae bacterium]